MSDFSTIQSDSGSEQEYEARPQGIQQLIPMFVGEMCKNPQSVELRVSYDAPTLQSTYTYSITWEDDVDHEKEYREMLDKMEEFGKKKKKFGNTLASPIPVPAVCDGPCKKSFPSNLLNSIGRCGHYLCAACFGIVKNSDGTNGCSAAHCNWNGDTRKDAKKYFEKEICQKQRIRAREMKNAGADVKSASSASHSSRTNSKKSSPTTTVSSAHSSDETDCSVFLASPRPASSKFYHFHLTYPSKQEIIGVKLFILEEMLINGQSHNVAELEFASSELVKHAITALIVQKYKMFPTKHKGVLYHVELMPSLKRRLRRVRSRDYMTMALFDFSQIAEHIVFLLDFNDFVTDGQGVNIG